MKLFLVLSQILYLLCMIPWLFVWGISFMSFDQGFGLANVSFVAGIGLYPVAAIVCAILAWRFHRRRKKTAIVVNLIPMAWILGLGVPLLFINFS
ncbi:hypothetical protein [Cohnella nanjingensis]|uniref:Uncharacterized protein n=1 Tax=Cohnella nanjingensis TaxID=1387779 RepID=A0A7X0VD55_9BACL|nr:hypothetical protein [Cohnella nanjingensis]MBB6669610.1 hypothetical protein [Cohnella nanjingensis]